MTHPDPSPPRFQVQKNSDAVEWAALLQDVRDAVVDFWHHPAVVKLASRNAAGAAPRVHLQCVIQPKLLSPVQTHEVQQALGELCRWLHAQQVTYEIGYIPVIEEGAEAHITVELGSHKVIVQALHDVA
jgi:hypothetical protein